MSPQFTASLGQGPIKVSMRPHLNQRCMESICRQSIAYCCNRHNRHASTRCMRTKSNKVMSIDGDVKRHPIGPSEKLLIRSWYVLSSAPGLRSKCEASRMPRDWDSGPKCGSCGLFGTAGLKKLLEQGNTMKARLDYWKLSPEGLAAFRHLQTYIDQCGLDKRLIELVKTRASQLNGCAYCLDMHTKDARARGETEQRL